VNTRQLISDIAIAVGACVVIVTGLVWATLIWAGVA